MSVPGYPGFYVLGCFAPRVTFLSQQIRALNLVDALCKAGKLSTKSRVAVVGAGVAGLTAAAGLAVRGVSVRIFERFGKKRLMPLQENSRQRVVHPHIYDWPADGSLEERTGLPLLDWEANEANEVIEEIETAWNDLPKEVRDRIEWDEFGEVCENENGRLVRNGSFLEGFQVIILAVGFGVEEDTGTDSYWTDDGIDSFERDQERRGQEKLTWLVSGAGDGALTDVMRLCIRKFRQDDHLLSFAKSVPSNVTQRLVAAETDPNSDFFTIYQNAALELPATVYLDTNRERELPAQLEFRNLPVQLNCGPAELFAPGSSILNRLVIAYLYVRGAFSKEILHRFVRVPVEREDGRYKVIFEGEVQTPELTTFYDRVVIRHGPKRALEKRFPGIWKACRTKKRIWDAARSQQGLDWTRQPWYKNAEFRPKALELPPLRIDWGEEVGCLVVVPSGGASLATKYVDQALSRLSTTKLPDGKRLVRNSAVLEIKEVFSSPDRYTHALRALCSSEIAVFHVEGYDCATLLLLGVRSVVRRGVTVTVLSDPLGDEAWAKLPFNLREIKPLSIAENKQTFTARLTETIRTGIWKKKSLPRSYLDLPSYDAVRSLGPELQDHEPIVPTKLALILCSFGEQYLDELGEFVRSVVDTACGVDNVAKRIVDSDSPQLVSQRLHEAIRRSQLCVVDWTEWKSNVFFEFGIRLAVNEVDPLCILSSSWEPQKTSDQERISLETRRCHGKALEDFFRPIDYSGIVSGPLEEEIRQHTASIQKGDRRSRQRGILSPGLTYRVVQEAIDIRQEPGGTPVTRLLVDLVNGMTSTDPIQQNVFPALYADNLELQNQLQVSSVEYLLAAWYYLLERGKLRERRESGSLDPQDPTLEELRKIGNGLSNVLLQMRGWDHVLSEITDELNSFDGLGGTA
jgi:hypothetical protein